MSQVQILSTRPVFSFLLPKNGKSHVAKQPERHLCPANKQRGRSPAMFVFTQICSPRSASHLRFFNLYVFYNIYTQALFARIVSKLALQKRFRFSTENRKFDATNARGTSSSHCKLSPRPVGQRASFSCESDAPRTFSLTLLQPSAFFQFMAAMNVEIHEFLGRIQSDVNQREGREPLSPKRYLQKLTLRTVRQPFAPRQLDPSSRCCASSG